MAKSCRRVQVEGSPDSNGSMETSEGTQQVRKDMHDAIDKGDIGWVEKCLEKAKTLRMWLNPESRESALYSAVQTHRYNISALLLCHNCKYNEDDDEEKGFFRDLTQMERLELEYQQSSFLQKYTFVSILLRKSVTKGNDSKFAVKLEQLYQKLGEIPMVKSILQIVALSMYSEIIYDRDKDDVECLVGRGYRSTRGLTLSERDRIYIAANRNDEDLLGTMAHEFCHYALHLVFENLGKPYRKGDEENQRSYSDIFYEIKIRKDDVHPVIQNAFSTKYISLSDQEDELIVRVPHILALKGERRDSQTGEQPCEQEKSGGEILEEQVPKLLNFFSEVVFPEMEKYLFNHCPQKDKEEIEKEKLRLGTVKEILSIGEKVKFTTTYCLRNEALDIVPAPSLAFSEMWINGAVKSTGKSYLLIRTSQWDSKVYDVLENYKCHIVVISSDNVCDLKKRLGEQDYEKMLKVLARLSEYRHTKVVVLAADAEQDQLVSDIKRLPFFTSRVHCGASANTGFDLVEENCKNDILSSSHICLQGPQNQIKVSDMNSPAVDVVREDIFLTLCRQKRIEVGPELPQLDKDVQRYYVERTCKRMTQVDLPKALYKGKDESFAIIERLEGSLRCSVSRRHNVLHDNQAQGLGKYFRIDSLDDYNALTQRGTKGRTIHLLEYDSKRQAFYWVKSNGPVSHLPIVPSKAREFSETKSVLCDTSEKVVVICGAPGIGKTLMATRLAGDIKTLDKMLWVLHVDLPKRIGSVDLTAPVNDINAVATRLAILCCIKEDALEFKLLVESINNASPFKVVVIFDALDEIVVQCRKSVINFVHALSETKISKIFLFSRKVWKSELEDTFHTISFEVAAFTWNEQLQFLKGYWKQNGRNDLVDSADDNFKKLHSLLGTSIMNNPLLISMVAEIVDELRSEAEAENRRKVIHGQKSSVLYIYETFVEHMFKIYLKKKSGQIISNENVVGPQRDCRVLMEDLYKKHCLLALKAAIDRPLLTELVKETTLEQLEPDGAVMKDVVVGRLQHGLVDGYVNGTPVFVHKTFAEYFAAYFLCNKIHIAEHAEAKVLRLVPRMYGNEHYEGILNFLDVFGAKACALHCHVMDNDTTSVRNSAGECYSIPDEFGRTPLHISVLHGNEQTYGIIAEKLSDKMAEELQVEDKFGMTAIMYADRMRAWKRLDLLCACCDGANIEWTKQLPIAIENMTREKRFADSLLYDAVLKELRRLLRCLLQTCCAAKDAVGLQAVEGQERRPCSRTEQKLQVDVDGIRCSVLYTPIFHAMSIDIFRALLPYSNIGAEGKNGFTLLHMNAALGHVEICKNLLYRLPVDKRDSEGQTPLHVSVFFCHPDTVHALLPHIASTDTYDREGNMALHLTAKNKTLRELETICMCIEEDPRVRPRCTLHRPTSYAVVLKALLPHMDPTARDNNGDTTMHISAFYALWDLTVALLPFSDCEATNDAGHTPLLRSVAQDHLRQSDMKLPTLVGDDNATRKVVSTLRLLLLHSGVDVIGKDGRTAFHQCARHNRLEVVKLLLPHASPSVTSTSGITFLHYAATNDNVDAVKLVLPRSRVNARDPKGKTPLHYSASFGYTAVVSTLLPFTCSKVPGEHITLHDTARGGYAVTAELLVSHSSASRSDGYGRTALHLGADNAHVEVLRKVIPHVDVHMRDRSGNTGLHLSAYRHCSDAVKLLLPYSKLMATNKSGKTALTLSFNEDAQWREPKQEDIIDSIEGSNEAELELLKGYMNTLVPSWRNALTLISERKNGMESVLQSARIALESTMYDPDSYEAQLPADQQRTLNEMLERPDVLRMMYKSSQLVLKEHLKRSYMYKGTDIETPKMLLRDTFEKTKRKLKQASGLAYDGDVKDGSGFDSYMHGNAEQSDKIDMLFLGMFEPDNRLGTQDLTVIKLLLLHSEFRDELEASQLCRGNKGLDAMKLVLPHSTMTIANAEGMTELHYAAEADKIDVVKFLLPRSSVNARNFKNQVPLDVCASSDKADVVKALLPLTSTDIPGGRKRSPLHDCVKKGNTVTTELLLPHSSASWCDTNDRSLLPICASFGHVGAARIILPHSDALIRDDSGNTALHLSAYHHNWNAVRLLIPYCALDVADGRGKTALALSLSEHAPRGGQHARMATRAQQLLESQMKFEAKGIEILEGRCDPAEIGDTLHIRGGPAAQDHPYTRADFVATVDEAFRMAGTMPTETSASDRSRDTDLFKLLLLHSSAVFTDEEAQRSILKEGLGVLKLLFPHLSYQSVSTDGMTPLHFAASKGNDDAARLLLPCSSTNARNSNDETPLHLSASSGYTNTVKVLFPLTSTRIPDASEHTLLHHCATKDSTVIASILLPHMSCFSYDKDGCSPLQACASLGHAQVARLILPHSDILNGDNSGNTAMHLSVRKPCCDLVRRFLPYFALDIRNESGKTAFAMTFGEEASRREFRRESVSESSDDEESMSSLCNLMELMSGNTGDLLREAHRYLSQVPYMQLLTGISPDNTTGMETMMSSLLNAVENPPSSQNMLSNGSLLETALESIMTGLEDTETFVADDGLATREIEMRKLLLLHSNASISDEALLLNALDKGLSSLKLLIPHSSTTVVTSDGRIPLHCAAERGNFKAAKFLLPCSHVNARNHEDKTPLDVSALRGYADAVKLLLPLTSDTFHGPEERTLLHYCAVEGIAGVLELLIPYSLVSAVDKYALTALHLSAEEGHVECVRALLPHSDTLIEDHEEDTVLHVSSYGHSYSAVELLIPYCDVDATNSYDKTPLEYIFGKGEQSQCKVSGQEGIRMVKLILIHTGVYTFDRGDCTALVVSMCLRELGAAGQSRSDRHASSVATQASDIDLD